LRAAFAFIHARPQGHGSGIIGIAAMESPAVFLLCGWGYSRSVAQGRAMPIRRLPVVVAALGLAACAPSAPSSRSTQPRSALESPAMTSTATASQSYSPRLDAEQSLSRLLDLIEDSKTIEDIDVERLRSVFGVAFDEDAGRFGFAEQLSDDWWTSYEWDPERENGPQFEFAFRPSQAGAYPAATDVCALDFARFAAELQKRGFNRETYRAEHNRVIHDRFEREGLTVTVYTRGESDASPEQIAHACVQMVHIH
jgi:hypothetical protein